MQQPSAVAVKRAVDSNPLFNGRMPQMQHGLSNVLEKSSTGRRATWGLCPPRLFARALLLFLALGLSANSALAEICTTCDETPPAHSQVTGDQNLAASLIAPNSDTDECGFTCQSCICCGACCGHTVAPLNAAPLLILRSHVLTPHPGANADEHAQSFPSNLLRPPITG